MGLLWEIAGWLGASAIFGAYMAVSMGWLKAGRLFQLANLFGACAFIANSGFHGAWPSVVSNIAWLFISAIALFRMRSKRQLLKTGKGVQVRRPGIPNATGRSAAIDISAHSMAREADDELHACRPAACHTGHMPVDLSAAADRADCCLVLG